MKKQTAIFALFLAVFTVLMPAQDLSAKGRKASGKARKTHLAVHTKKGKVKSKKKAVALAVVKKAAPFRQVNNSPLRPNAVIFTPLNTDSISMSLLTRYGGEGSISEAHKKTMRERLVAFSKTLLGRPYIWASEGPRGFDCSGFTKYVFGKMGFEIPRGSAEMPEAGRPVAAKNIQKGDIIVFTGTNLAVREPGHVGIVISEKGKPVRFIHSSSAGGVKISALTDGKYQQRYLMARRVM